LRISTAKACGKALSPSNDSPLSSTTAYSPFSPSDWKLRYLEGSRSATVKPVSVRQVVTRTVTYKRTPLDPPPKGKRRRTSTSSESWFFWLRDFKISMRAMPFYYALFIFKFFCGLMTLR
jgi:hypothetical protein